MRGFWSVVVALAVLSASCSDGPVRVDAPVNVGPDSQDPVAERNDPGDRDPGTPDRPDPPPLVNEAAPHVTTTVPAPTRPAADPVSPPPSPPRKIRAEILGVKDGVHYAHGVTPSVDAVGEVKVLLNGRESPREMELSEDGSYVIEVMPKDAGCPGPIQRVSFVVDTTPPRIVIEGVSSGQEYLPGVAALIRIIDDHADDEECLIKLNGAPYASGEPIMNPNSYRLCVAAVDAAGNRTVGELQFVVSE